MQKSKQTQEDKLSKDDYGEMSSSFELSKYV